LLIYIIDCATEKVSQIILTIKSIYK
jgi:hypothetical protein